MRSVDDGERRGVRSTSVIRSDERAVRSVDAGDQFEQLYRASRGRLYNLAARVVGNPDDAADIVQEVFLRAYARGPESEAGQTPDAWLYRVTVNACYDHLRGRRVSCAIPLDEAGEIAAQGDGFARAELARDVQETLAGMNVRYRTALILRDLHGLDVGEVATVMDVSGPTARVLLHRARGAFRRAFRDVAPAGYGTVPALGLAAFLPELPLPAALLPNPSWAALAPFVPLAPLPAAGLLTELGSALSAKAVALIVAATVATGGGLVVHQLDGSGGAAGKSHTGPLAAKALPGPEGAANDVAARTQVRAGGHAPAGDSRRQVRGADTRRLSASLESPSLSRGGHPVDPDDEVAMKDAWSGGDARASLGQANGGTGGGAAPSQGGASSGSSGASKGGSPN